MDSKPKTSSNEGTWSFLGQRIPQTEIQYITQVVIIYMVVITCIINLSLSNGDSNLWTALLSSSLGYMLPNPSLKKKP